MEKQSDVRKLENGYVMLRVKTTRGTNPRDTDEVSGELVVETLDELKEQLDEFHEVVYGEGERARKFLADGEPVFR